MQEKARKTKGRVEDTTMGATKSGIDVPTNGIAEKPNDAILRIGGVVAQYRARLGQVQKKLAESVVNTSRTEIAELEEGHRLPSPDKLEAICEALKIPRRLWAPATHPEFLLAMEFQTHLSELLGKPLSLERLGPDAGCLAIERVSKLLKGQHSSSQAYDYFKSVLTFYGEKGPTRAFFDRFLGPDAFKSLDNFRIRVREFLVVGLRLYGNFRRSWKALSPLEDLTEHLRPLEAIDVSSYTQRRPFKSITSISTERLDDLGYISVERARKENRDREFLSQALSDLATAVEKRGVPAVEGLSAPKSKRMKVLLQELGSSIDLSASLFSTLSPTALRTEAARLKPSDADLARIEETQKQGLRNLCGYLSEPYIDVYVATSMREHADFVAVNGFVESVFAHSDIAPLNLRYFNPTQSWIEDRVAKGLVEALMLRRAAITVYMAQRGDTFGKDSEASVALGQGKAVIVYVPRLANRSAGIDSARTYKLTEVQLRDRLRELEVPEDELLEHRELFVEVIKAELARCSGEELAKIVRDHWADFDLAGEVKSLPGPAQRSWTEFLTKVQNDAAESIVPDQTLSGFIVERLSSLALLFERRASLFRETHPLSLQVIVETGVLNGMMVVRSVDECAALMYQLLSNKVEMDIVEDDSNYMLCERMTKSALRVVSKFPLLTNAFWTQYFD